MGLSLNTIILGVVGVGMAILLVLTHADATQQCNVEWQLKLQTASAELMAKVAAQNSRIVELEKAIVKAVEDRKLAIETNNKALETQRETIPLSKACSECRIPRDRIWLRSGNGNRSGAGS